ncbi:hypothetical protein sscle_13g095490 [Sclerotinia sclerotiorum 1980 UF-70]|uniref:non-specific serine/threonine protein kinase n=1 Tax=Sclerotinia sclerotiorum (strain ATCC 18683 / 1980 / Ss-1) TaxID=665079 RepID=A0A1D9QIR8_SCLS1|nr:hypothetical protein sscle_13g095490 [Sclerotinia sclerotiorum 1980 UF-70]
MAQPANPDNVWDRTNKVVEILGDENVDKAARKKLAALFSDIEADIEAHVGDQVDESILDYQNLQQASEDRDAKRKELNEAKGAAQLEKDRRKTWFKDVAIPTAQHLRAIRESTIPIRNNKWRKNNAGLTSQNIKILTVLGYGGFGAVYLIENTDTKARYAMKFQGLREEDDGIEWSKKPGFTGARTPPLTPSSEASKLSERIMKERHLLTKRFNETKCYLRYIRSGHPSICSMEAFFDHRGGGEIFSISEDIAHGHIFEYCDWGNLENLVDKYYETPRYGVRRRGDKKKSSRPEGMPPLYKHAAIPEAFIWHVFLQLMDGLSFLHGDHELNKQDEFHRRNQIICVDIKLDNIFLKDSGVPNTYPTVKIGDFGEALYVPYGESRWQDAGTTLTAPSDEPWYSAKYDVWCAGITLYIMTHSGRQPNRIDDTLNEKNDLSIEPRWTRPDAHLSQTLCRELERPIEMDMEKRWTAIKIFNRIKPMAEERIRSTYRELQDWVKPDLSNDNFNDGYLEWVQGGGVPSDYEEDVKDDEEDNDDDDDAGGGSGDSEKHAEIPDPPAAPISEKQSSKNQREELSKRRREEEERGKENLPPARPSKRRLTRYRKLRAYRV